MIKQIFMAVLGGCAGFGVSGGVFTTLIAIGLIPRFAGKTHTAKHIFFYEEMVVCGTLFGGILTVFLPFIKVYEWMEKITLLREAEHLLGPVFLGGFGIFAGVFVGCLALAIAEMLDSIPIFARRAKFRQGIGIAVLFMALGKMVGSLVYFMKQIFEYGGM